MKTDTQIYISLEDSKRRLVVDGSMSLFRELLSSVAPSPETERQSNIALDMHDRGGVRQDIATAVAS